MVDSCETQMRVRDLISAVVAGEIEGVVVDWVDVCRKVGEVGQVREERTPSIGERLAGITQPKRWEIVDGQRVEVDRIHVGRPANSRLAGRMERRLSRELVGRHIVAVKLGGAVDTEIRLDSQDSADRLLGLLAAA